ncbi:MAG: Fic family protein [Bacteroidota bacterium]
MDTTSPYVWRPITDLPVDRADLEDDGLRQLAPLWEEQREGLAASESVQEFNKRLLRRQAIETGLIERLYTFDHGITQLLVEQGLDASLIPHDASNQGAQHVVELIRDQHSAVEGLFTFVKQDRQLSTSYIKELHQTLTFNQSSTEAVTPDGNIIEVPLLKGEYKKHPNNPRRVDGTVHEYAPPDHVASEMDRLVELHRAHEAQGVAPEVSSAWLHHRFTQIHPFQDGNGRVARALASLVFLREGWFPLLITNDQRAVYIRTLEAADRGDLEPLVSLFAKAQRQAFQSAISTAKEVRDQERHVGARINALKNKFIQQSKTLSEEYDKAKSYAQDLHTQAYNRLKALARDLGEELGPHAPPGETFRFFADEDNEDVIRQSWHRYPVIESAKSIGYFADLRSFSKWVRLVIDATNRSEILVSFHAVGREFPGVVNVSATFYTRAESGDGTTTITSVEPLTDDAFQILYTSDLTNLQRRFETWLDGIITNGLAAYDRGL